MIYFFQLFKPWGKRGSSTLIYIFLPCILSYSLSISASDRDGKILKDSFIYAIPVAYSVP